ncbi:MAG: TolC family protein [Halieaceae bacterium]|jgi:outer membrane protein TolC|nr:TolC family protein [Halieaceae bacterium]
MRVFFRAGALFLLASWALPSAAQLSLAAPISLPGALKLAGEHDPWIDRSSQIEAALAERGQAAAALPDPVLSLGVANLPTDSFRFDQEQMTQARIGVTQRLPRGKSRALEQQRFMDLKDREPQERARRRAEVQRDVTLAWLAAWRAQRSAALLEDSRGLFAYLVELARSRYTTALGRAQQQDVVRSELELTRLDDRLYRRRSDRDAALATLAGWLVDPRDGPQGMTLTAVEDAAPELDLPVPGIADLEAAALDAMLASRLQAHPELRSLDQRIAASRTERELAEQAYRPALAINASYGYRDDAPTGDARADFFSVGVALDLPLFTASRQDPQVRAATADTESLRTERALLLRDLHARVRVRLARLRQLEQRADLYRTQLLPQMTEQAAAYLSAYRADEADFSDVVSARVDELNARIEAVQVDAERFGTIAELNYLLAAVPATGDAS